jgi:hypothetical protein
MKLTAKIYSAANIASDLPKRPRNWWDNILIIIRKKYVAKKRNS